VESTELYTEEYYERLRREYVTDTSWKQNRIANVLELLKSITLKDAITLDIACGIGTFTVETNRMGAAAIGLDYSLNAMAASSRLYQETTGNKGVFLASDALFLPLKDNSIDIVICADFIEHITAGEYRNLVSECWRILKPGGHLVIYTPNRHHFLELMMKNNFILKKDESHIDIKTMNSTLGPLKENGFHIVKHYYRPTHITFLKSVERICLYLPFAGELFRRRICVLARKPGG